VEDKEMENGEGEQDEFKEEELEISSDEEDGSSDEAELEEEDENDPDNYSELEIHFNVDFPKEIDFHGVKNFTKGFISSPTFNASEFSDLIIGQKKIGHMIRIEGNDEIFGFITCLNMHKHSKLQCMKQIKDFVMSKAGENSEKLKKVIDAEGLGLLVSERMLNVPYDLVLPVYRALFANMEAFVEEEKGAKNAKKGRGSFEFDHYLIFTDFQQKTAKSKHKGKKTKHTEDDTIEYSKIEDEYFRKYATIQFTYPIIHGDQAQRWTLGGTMTHFGLVMLLEKKKMDAAILEMESILED